MYWWIGSFMFIHFLYRKRLCTCLWYIYILSYICTSVYLLPLLLLLLVLILSLLLMLLLYISIASWTNENVRNAKLARTPRTTMILVDSHGFSCNMVNQPDAPSKNHRSPPTLPWLPAPSLGPVAGIPCPKASWGWFIYWVCHTRVRYNAIYIYIVASWYYINLNHIMYN